AYMCVKERAIEVPVKTERSKRTVIIDNPASDRLMELRESGPLVPNMHGERMNPCVVAKRWRCIVNKRGLKSVPLKNLRTSYATMLKQCGTDNATISELLGHTNISTAYDHYFAINVDAHKGVAGRLRAAISTEM
ncbi:MAG: tyrosine-type recombinase/integrase, partial [Raoultibacter sp.]